MLKILMAKLLIVLWHYFHFYHTKWQMMIEITYVLIELTFFFLSFPDFDPSGQKMPRGLLAIVSSLMSVSLSALSDIYHDILQS